MLKQIMIPAALFAVTATTASAFSGDILRRLDLDLSEQQIQALEEAKELRKEGDFTAARERLEEAAVTPDTLLAIHSAIHAEHAERRTAVHSALEAGDYPAFTAAIAGSRLADIIDSKDKFKRFRVAEELREAGDYEGARDILTELGFAPKLGVTGSQRGSGMHHGKYFWGLE